MHIKDGGERKREIGSGGKQQKFQVATSVLHGKLINQYILGVLIFKNKTKNDNFDN